MAISGTGRRMSLNGRPLRSYWYIISSMAHTNNTFIMHMPCSHISTTFPGNFVSDSICPKCLSSTDEELDVTKCLSTIETQKCAEAVCSKQPKAFFWPCQHNFFCQNCAETHFERQKTGRERCLCGESIEDIYTMITTDQDNETTPKDSAL